MPGRAVQMGGCEMSGGGCRAGRWLLRGRVRSRDVEKRTRWNIEAFLGVSGCCWWSCGGSSWQRDWRSLKEERRKSDGFGVV